MRSNMLAVAIAASLGLISLVVTNPSHAAEQNSNVTAEQMQQMQAQIASLQSQLDALQAQSDAQSDINVAEAQNTEAAQATKTKVDKLAKLVNDTQLNGKMFFDLTNVSQKSNGAKTNASGTGFDVKRFYLSVSHKFDDVWSANLTTDFQYVSKLDSAADIYVKKVYLQGKFSDAFIARAGSADMPWIPFAENYYGFRYVENTLTDRLKYGTSADWGLHAFGDVAGKRANYAVSVVNGAGYKNPSRSKGMDIEGRVGFVPVDGMVVAVGAYSGTLGKETNNVNALHTATRGDVMVAYAGKAFRIGGEYFQATNWGNVLTAASDKADGYSLWGSFGFGASGVTAFARYDQANLSKSLDPSLKDTYYNFGVEFPIRKGVKLAAVYKNDHQKNNTTVDLKTQEVGVWGEVAF